jgi:hypothetical protein
MALLGVVLGVASGALWLAKPSAHPPHGYGVIAFAVIIGAVAYPMTRSPKLRPDRWLLWSSGVLVAWGADDLLLGAVGLSGSQRVPVAPFGYLIWGLVLTAMGSFLALAPPLPERDRLQKARGVGVLTDEERRAWYEGHAEQETER